MDIANVRAHYKPIPSHSHSNSRTQNFYDTSLSVLFDLPNAIVVSTYVLLTLVWAERFLQSRFHTESAGEWQKRCFIYRYFVRTLPIIHFRSLGRFCTLP